MLYQFQINHINLDANRSPVLSYPLKIVMESNCRFLVDIVSGGKNICTPWIVLYLCVTNTASLMVLLLC